MKPPRVQPQSLHPILSRLLRMLAGYAAKEGEEWWEDDGGNMVARWAKRRQKRLLEKQREKDDFDFRGHA